MTIFSTRNKENGFWGTMVLRFRETGIDNEGLVKEDWEQVSAKLQTLFPGLAADVVRDFLDSPMGRFYADLHFEGEDEPGILAKMVRSFTRHYHPKDFE